MERRGTADNFMKPKTLEEAMDLNRRLHENNAELLAQLDKVNMINGAVLAEVTSKGSLTKDRYNVLYAQVIAQWQAKQLRKAGN